MSYAASFGMNSLDLKTLNIISPLLNEFNYVSVREKSGLNICKQCGVEAEWVPDPTMLLTPYIYKKMYNNELIEKPKKKYCFFYLIQDESTFSTRTLYDWAKKCNLEVIYIAAHGTVDNYKKKYATIPEFIYFLENAEYIITNSYHCAVFSLLFNKKFAIIPRSRKFSSMNDRFDSLFEQFELESRFLSNDFSVLEGYINWERVSNGFNSLRANCRLISVIKSFEKSK